MPGLPTATFSAPQTNVAEDIFRWQPLACLDLSCELQSPVASVFKRAELLFGARRSTPNVAVAPDFQHVLRWRVALENSPEDIVRPWRVDNLFSGATRCCKNEQHALTLIEYAAVQSLVERVKDSHRNQSFIEADAIFALHGALLCKDGFGITVVGPSESGKSTLSCALWQNGWSLLSDDFCFFRRTRLSRRAPGFSAKRQPRFVG